jgi:glycosyltransferase involved in cell wall biosynthesis
MLGNILKALGMRFEADILTIRESEMGYIEKYKKNRILRVPVGGDYINQIESFQRALSRQLDGDEYDVIHFRSPWEGAVISQKKPYIDSHIIYEPSIALPSGADKALEKKFLENEELSMSLADMLIVNSNEDRNILRHMYPDTTIKVMQQGVNVDVFDWDVTIGLSTMDIVWVDNFYDKQAIELVLAGLEIIKNKYPDFSFGMILTLLSGFHKLLSRDHLLRTLNFLDHRMKKVFPYLSAVEKLPL